MSSGGKGERGWEREERSVNTRDNIHRITKPRIQDLARRGGVKRINGVIYETRDILKIFLENIIGDTVTYTENS
ncbi:unnamed protein product [Linum tenue]|uniref:Histone H4 n=1 Tax=Linum tenue TaxID=586396 RepID=A0AAV0MMB6_9ROSI|nr:unnamed protein product [Linum tenue]